MFGMEVMQQIITITSMHVNGFGGQIVDLSTMWATENPNSSSKWAALCVYRSEVVITINNTAASVETRKRQQGSSQHINWSSSQLLSLQCKSDY